MTMHEITKEQAITALTAAAFTPTVDCEWPGCTHHHTQPPIVHCFRGFIGADWDLDDAIAEVRVAQRVGWVEHLAGHDLTVITSEYSALRFDVRQPEAADVT